MWINSSLICEIGAEHEHDSMRVTSRGSPMSITMGGRASPSGDLQYHFVAAME